MHEPRGASPLRMCRNIVSQDIGDGLGVDRILGGGWEVGGLEKGGNAPQAMDSQRFKSSTSSKSFQHCQGWSDCARHIIIGDFCCLWDSQ